MRFEWDPGKDEQNRRERGFGFDFAALIFESETIERLDDRRDYSEVRVRAIGETDGFVLYVVFTDRGNVRRIISARLASRKEREQWHARR